MSMSAPVYETILRFPVGTKFVASEIKEKIPQKVSSNNVYTAISYLKKLGAIRNVNTWDGTNVVTYEVLDNTVKINPGRKNGLGLYNYRVQNPGRPQSQVKMRVKTVQASSVPELLTRIENLFTQVLLATSETPRSSLSGFTTKELLDEVSARTTQKT